MILKKPSINDLFASALEYHQRGDFQKAKTLYTDILKNDSLHIGANNNLGNIFIELNNFQKALYYYQKVLEVDSNHANANNNIGYVYIELNNYSDAIIYFKKAIEINPMHLDAHFNLFKIFKKMGMDKESKNYYKKILEIEPNNENAYYNFGNILNELNEFHQALYYFNKVLTLNSNHANTYNNIGYVNNELGYYDKAISSYKKAIKINPNHSSAHYNLGITLLLMSNFKKGFEEYEWRKKKLSLKKYYAISNLKTNEWKGESLVNKKLLIFAEQGVGDIIQFARYIYQLQNKYKNNIIFKTTKKFKHLFNYKSLNIITEEDEIPKHDFHIYMMSLPKLLNKNEKFICKEINYLKKAKCNPSKWKKVLSLTDELKIGINWQGNKNYKHDSQRSIPLNLFEPLFKVKGVKFINLQKGDGVEQIKEFNLKNNLLLSELEIDNSKNIFEDTLGIIKNLDLIITIDSALAHLSATMGKKTWILLKNPTPHWVWFLNSLSSPWYKEVTLYRQKKMNDWKTLFKQIKKDLINFEKNHQSNDNR